MMSNLQTSKNTRLSEKSKQCKKILLLGFCLFLTGCGENGLNKSYNVQKFKIQSTTFEVLLPKTWTILTPNNQKGEVIVAQKNDENFVILHQNNYSEKISNKIQSELNKTFFSFKLIAKNKHSWHFKGKLSAQTPLRDFHQKIIPIQNSNQFLFGSCSFEPLEEEFSDCTNLLESFRMTTD